MLPKHVRCQAALHPDEGLTIAHGAGRCERRPSPCTACRAAVSTMAEIACVDDIAVTERTRSLQASATWETEAGVTYLVQVGGFGGQAGRLKLTLE